MENCEILAWYGGFVLLITGGFILVPYLRGKADLVSAWNLFLMGIAIFVGIGSIEASVTPMRFPGLEWFHPTKAEVNWYLAATTVFLITLFASYYYDPLSRRVGARAFNNWPPISTGVLFSGMVLCLILAGLSQVEALRGITFIGPFLLNVSHKAFVFGCVFSFVLWYRQKVNVIWLGVFLAVFLTMCVLSMVMGPGRRLLLSLLLCPVLVVYYAHARRWRPLKGVVVVAAALLVIFVINLMYSSIRHINTQGQERSASVILQEMKKLGERNWFGRFAQDRLFHFSQQVVHYALLTDRLVATNRLEARPLNTVAMIGSYPIPRNVWPEKPQILGIRIIQETNLIKNETNWGCGISGHAVYEGGMLVAALYAYLIVYLIRLFDDPLRRQPMNPFLIAMFASASTHLLAWARGDLAIMTLESVECFFFAIALGLAGRLIFGTARVQQASPLPMVSLPVGVRRATAR